MEFRLHSDYAPTGDQPEAIRQLTEGFREGNQAQTLLGVTGSGKTFTMANIIARLQKPTLVIAHNKTLAGQLYGEFREFFPENAVEYFVSYYDYYQPEAYVPQSDTYIEKDSSTNEEIDRLRLSATASLVERKDVIVVASVSCIYGLGSPVDFRDMVLYLRQGEERERNEIMKKLIELHYDRSDVDFHRSTFRVRGDVLEIFPADTDEYAYRVEFFGDEIDRITEIDPLTGRIRAQLTFIAVFPASHYVTPQDKLLRATKAIEEELEERVKYFKSEDRLLEAQRIAERTNYDIEMLRETGFCSGIENYSRHMEGRPAGSPPQTLMDYFPDEYLIIIDESHMTLPQIRAMYNGDQSRKSTLVDYGFRLPSAKDNRPLKFEEFEEKIDQILFVSATPGPYEAEHELLRAEQIIRPTGLLDPEISVRPVAGQVDDLIAEVQREAAKGKQDTGHDADQENGGGPDGLHARRGRARSVHALGHRHARAGEDHPRHAPERVRCPRRHQPAARGPGHPGDHAGGDPRRGQGRVPALGDRADPDDRPRGPQLRGPCDHVRRHGHGLDAARDRRDGAPPEGAEALQ